MKLRQWRRMERKWKREHIRKRRHWLGNTPGIPLTSVTFGGVDLGTMTGATFKMKPERKPLAAIELGFFDCSASVTFSSNDGMTPAVSV